MEGVFSPAPLAALLAAEGAVCAAGVARPPGAAGPAPLFWVFHGQTSHSRADHSQTLSPVQPTRADARPGVPLWLPNEGLGNAGVTVHLLDERADAGDIVAQAPIVLPDGITYSAA